MTQQTLWRRACDKHDPVVSHMKDGTVIRACRRCGRRLG